MTMHSSRLLFVVALLALASAVPLHADLVVSPSNVNLQAQPGANPSPQLVSVQDSNGATVPFTVSNLQSAGWLTVNPTVGNTGSSAFLQVSAFSAGLAQGLYTGSFMVSASGQSVTVTVNLAVSNGPLILANPASLTFSTASSASPLTQTISITNAGTGSLTFSAAANSAGNWLSVSASSGTAPATLTVTATPGSLTPASYSGTIVVTGSAGNSPLTINVTMDIGQGPILNLVPTRLTFNGAVGDRSPDAQIIGVSNSGVGEINFTAVPSTTSGGNWLRVSPASGATPLAINASVVITGLAPGTYNGQIVITAAAGAVGSPATIPVTLVLTATPTIALSPSSLNFSAIQGAPSPAAQSLLITNSGGGALQYSVAATTTSGGPWLSVANAGSVPANLAVSVNTSGLAPGTYTGTLTFTSSFAANSPQTIPVTLTVSGGTTGLSASASSLNFYTIPGGSNPSPQVFTISTSVAGGSFTTAATTTSGGNWLSVSPASGTAPANLTVNVNNSGLSAGTYNGSVTVTAPGQANSPLTIAVNLQVVTGRIIIPNPASLSFSTNAGTSPGSKILALSVFGPGSLSYSFTATASTTSGGSWLSVTPASGNGATDLTVAVNSASLAPGTYNGTITLSSPNVNNSPLAVPVSLTVIATAQGVLASSSKLVQFRGDPGGASQNAQVSISSTGLNTLPFSVAVATLSGGTWLTATANSTSTPTSINIIATPVGLAAGSYQGTVTLTSSSASNSPVIINVEFAVGAPQIGAGGIVNGASFAVGAAISPGSISSLFGTRLTTATSGVPATALPLPTTLGGTQVLVNGTPVPLFFVSAGQINFQVPPNVSGTTATMAVVSGGLTSLPTTVNVEPARPGIFTATPGGSGPGAILNQDFSANTAANPAAVGSVILIYCTGLGATTPQLAAGVGGNTSEPLNRTVLFPTVTIAGANATVAFSGVAPGFVGLYQINATVPPVTVGAAVQLKVTINGVDSNTVTVALK